jgi:S1-C subfamily serine protease
MEEQKSGRVLRIVALVLALGLAMAWGMIIGGGLVYAWTHFVERPEHHAQAEVIAIPELSTELERYSVQLGALLVEVVPGSPAEEAGLRVGDRIIAVDGQRLGLSGDLAVLIGQYQPRDLVTLLVGRPGEKDLKVRVKLGAHPDKRNVAYLGVTYQASSPMELHPWEDVLPRQFKEQKEWPSEVPWTKALPGALVLQVFEDSPAWAAGLEEGDVIVAVDGKVVDGPQAVSGAMSRYEPGDRVVLTVYQPGDKEKREVKVRLAEHPDKEGRAYLGVHLGRYSGDESLE